MKVKYPNGFILDKWKRKNQDKLNKLNIYQLVELQKTFDNYLLEVSSNISVDRLNLIFETFLKSKEIIKKG